MGLQFSDGMKFDTSGKRRVERRSDGYYVVGGGMLMAVDSYEEGEALIQQMTQRADQRRAEADSDRGACILTE